MASQTRLFSSDCCKNVAATTAYNIVDNDPKKSASHSGRRSRAIYPNADGNVVLYINDLVEKITFAAKAGAPIYVEALAIDATSAVAVVVMW